MPGTGKDPKTYTTMNEVRYAPDGNHLIIKATAAGHVSGGVKGAGHRLAEAARVKQSKTGLPR
jgi:hypothetical protein